MGVKIIDGEFNNIGTVVRGTGDLDVEIHRGKYSNVKTVVDLSDPILISQLGLPEKTDPNQLIELVKLLMQKPDAPVEEKQAVIKASRLGQMFKAAEPLVKFGTEVIKLVSEITKSGGFGG